MGEKMILTAATLTVLPEEIGGKVLCCRRA